MNGLLVSLRRRLRLVRSSFFLPMCWMSAPQRQGMRAVYAFCGEVDDIADGSDGRAEKQRRLSWWEQEIARLYDGAPSHPITRALQAVIARYDLQQAHFQQILAGVRMDTDEHMLLPDAETLERYCYRVAGCVGLLSIRIFGCTQPASEDYAIALGHALQRTNILRDVPADARMGRIYLPGEWVRLAGLMPLKPAEIVTNPARLQPVCKQMAAQADDYYRQAAALIDPADAAALLPARMMSIGYRRLLQRMQADNWRYNRAYRLTLSDKWAMGRMVAQASKVNETPTGGQAR